MSEMEKMEKLAKPLAEYLEKNHHPHTAIIITADRVTVVEDLMSVPFKNPGGFTDEQMGASDIHGYSGG